MFNLFFTNQIFEDITKYTYSKIRIFCDKILELLENSVKYPYHKEIDVSEMRALIGLFYMCGTLRLNLRVVTHIFARNMQIYIFLQQ